MPIYQYQCPKCNFEFEIKQTFTDKPVASCPQCHTGSQRLFRPVPIIFKGSGFYVTDNATSSKPLSNTAESKSVAVEDKKETAETSTAKEAKTGDGE